MSVPTAAGDSKDHGINSIIIGLSWTLTSLAIIAVVARFWVRIKISLNLAIEDWLMLLALAFQILYQAILQIMCNDGIGKKYTDMTADEFYNSRMWMWISSPIANTVSIVSRISITILLIRIFQVTHPWFKWFLITFTTISVCLGIASPIVLFTQVEPVSALWSPYVVGVYRFTPYVQYYVSFTLQIALMVSDVTYSLIPVAIISRMSMRPHEKIGVILLMSLSLITCASETYKVALIIIQMTTTPTSVGGNLSYFNGLYNLMTGVEQCLVIIMGCIPPLRPITKVKWPFINSIGSSLASLVRIARVSKDADSSTGYRDKHIEKLEDGYQVGVSNVETSSQEPGHPRRTRDGSF